jgi:N-acetylmuramoyl-L-alanine amidase
VTSRLKQNATIHLLSLAIGSTGYLAPCSLAAQSAPPTIHNVIVLDPAHGGSDTGAHLADELEEKDATLTFATTLRTLLGQAGFTIVTTRDAELPTTAPVLTTDQRASTANHAHALACIVIHATASGSAIHLSTSALPAQSPDASPNVIPWDTAQATYIAQSRRLANDLGISLVHAQIPTLIGRSSVRPLDNLTCPAVAIEIAPLTVSGADNTPVTDSDYQQHIAQALSTALISWRNHIDPSATSVHPKETPAPRPKPQTVSPAPTAPPKSAISPTPPKVTPKPAPAVPDKPAPQIDATPKPPAQTPPPAPNPGATR